MNKNEKKLVIIDGNSLFNRAFYALPKLSNKKGIYTNAVYGFGNILFKIIREYNPSYFAVAFDLKKPTFRHKMYEEYKGTRKKMPDELRMQVPLIKKMVDYFGIKRLEIEGFEADDIIGTVSKKFEGEKIKTYVITGDKDSFQLAGEYVNILFTKKGISELDVIDKEEMINTYGITPLEFIDLKALMGDTSDNIKGVAGIGEKTGLKLIKEYHSIENIYENLESIKKNIREKLIADKESAFLSKELATIHTNIPLDFNIDELEFKTLSKNSIDKLNEFFIENEMFSLIKKLNEDLLSDSLENDDKTNLKELDLNYSLNIDEFIENIEKSKNKDIFIKLVKEENTVDVKSVLSLVIYYEDKFYIVDEKDLNKVKSVLESNNVKIYGFSLKDEYLGLLPYDISLNNIVYDLKICWYLLEPEKKDYDIYEIAIRYNFTNFKSWEDFFGKGKKELKINSFTKKAVEEYFSKILYVVKLSKNEMLEKIKKYNMEYLFNEVEMPLIKVLADMEYNGVLIDKEALKAEEQNFSENIENLQNTIHELAGENFNINSPKQLGFILFEKLGLPVIKKTKTGYSTDAKVLEALNDKHPIIDKITKYRTYTKLKSTYVDGLLDIINPNTNRIHSSFNQTVTSTGRISSTEPNLQNIPVRMDIGKNLRKAFIAKENCVLVDGDYSQIELRVLAHISNESALIEAFKNGEDIHRKTAAEVFNKNINEVTDEERTYAKAVNFGIVYGISGFGLSTNLKIPVKKADEYINTYLERYSNIKKYMDDIVNEAKEKGYVTTLLNRRRYIQELNKKNKILQNLGKRLAMNTPIQGSAADIIKIAMVRVENRLKKENLKSKLILQVHDELIIEALESEKDKVVLILKEEMENAYKMNVNLSVDINIGKSWFDAK